MICDETCIFFLDKSKTKRLEESDGEEEKMEKKKRRRIKRPEPDSSDEDGQFSFLQYFYCNLDFFFF